MSPQVDNFVHSLVEMARAQEMLPQVEADRDSLSRKLNETLDVVQSRELRIATLKAEIDELHNKVRSLEVERDDASFRVMEAEDREHAALNMAKSIASAVGNVINTLDPPKPEPVKEPEEGSSEANPSTKNHGQDQDANSQTAPVSGNAPLTDAVHSIEETTSGQSEGGPTANANAGEPKSEQTSATSSANEDATSAEPASGPYSGKLYYDEPNYISLHDWLASGGTEANYYWRPSHPASTSSH